MSIITGYRKNYLQRSTLALLATVIVGTTLLSGCAGGNGGGSASRAAMPLGIAINFTRATQTGQLPSSANSVVITITDSTGFTDTRTLNRPTSTTQTEVIAQFLALAGGKATINAIAYSGPNGTGEVIGQASAVITLLPSGTATPELTFIGIYSHLVAEDANNNPITGGVTVDADTTVQLHAQGYTASNLLADPSPAGNWTSSTATVATVNSTSGLVTGVGLGTTAITFTDSQTPSHSVVVNVTFQATELNAVTYTSNPNTTTLTTQPVTLTAVATDAKNRTIDNSLVTWQWQTSNSNVVSLSANGATATIAAAGAGTATITLTGTYQNHSGQTSTKQYVQSYTVVQTTP